MARIRGTHKNLREANAVQRVHPHPEWGSLRSGRLYRQMKNSTGRHKHRVVVSTTEEGLNGPCQDKWSPSPTKKNSTGRRSHRVVVFTTNEALNGPHQQVVVLTTVNKAGVITSQGTLHLHVPERGEDNVGRSSTRAWMGPNGGQRWAGARSRTMTVNPP